MHLDRVWTRLEDWLSSWLKRRRWRTAWNWFVVFMAIFGNFLFLIFNLISYNIAKAFDESNSGWTGNPRNRFENDPDRRGGKEEKADNECMCVCVCFVSEMSKRGWNELQEAEARLNSYRIGGSYTIPTHQTQTLGIQIQKHTQDIQDVGLRLFGYDDLIDNFCRLKIISTLSSIPRPRSTRNSRNSKLSTKAFFLFLHFQKNRILIILTKRSMKECP